MAKLSEIEGIGESCIARLRQVRGCVFNHAQV